MLQIYLFFIYLQFNFQVFYITRPLISYDSYFTFYRALACFTTPI